LHPRPRQGSWTSTLRLIPVSRGLSSIHPHHRSMASGSGTQSRERCAGAVTRPGSWRPPSLESLKYKKPCGMDTCSTTAQAFSCTYSISLRGKLISGEPGAGKLAGRVRRRGWWRRPEWAPRPAPILPHLGFVEGNIRRICDRLRGSGSATLHPYGAGRKHHRQLQAPITHLS
jgi:hypothetical protein